MSSKEKKINLDGGDRERFLAEKSRDFERGRRR